MNYGFDNKVGRTLLNAALLLCFLLLIYMANIQLELGQQFILGGG